MARAGCVIEHKGQSVSVINKMLRDLDARRGHARVPDLPQAVIPAAMEGTASVTAPASRRVLFRGLALALLVLLLAALAWYLHATQPLAPPTVVIVPPAPVASPVEAAVADVAQAQDSETVPSSGAAVTAVGREASPRAETPEVTTKRKKRRRRDEVVPAEPAADTPVVAPPPQRTRTVGTPQAVAPLATTAVQSEASPPATTQRRQMAALEALAQAQVLWNSGSREAALELVREAAVAVERAQPPEPGLLAQLVREQVRMELALGRPGPALAVLTRLESSLSGQADLWAVRGNAAQRLGRHQESVQAYLAALQLRPDEPRWMLGAAVSLAALGQLDAAARQAEQARALGPVSPEVLAYLRQAGVPLR